MCSISSSLFFTLFYSFILPPPPIRAEKLQLLNHRPQTAVEIQLVSVTTLYFLFTTAPYFHDGFTHVLWFKQSWFFFFSIHL